MLFTVANHGKFDFVAMDCREKEIKGKESHVAVF